MNSAIPPWQAWALLSAAFAALTAIFAKLGPAAQVAPIDKLSIVLVAIFATLFLGEKLSGKNWLGIALIAVGAILVASRR